MGLASSPLTTSIILSFLWDDHLGRHPYLVLILWVLSMGFEPFMSWMFHPKVSFLSLKTRNSLSSLVSCKPAEIIIGREDGWLIKTYLKLEGRGFNSNSVGSSIGGFSFGTLPHSNLSQLGGQGPRWGWRNVNIFSTSRFNSQSRSSLVRTVFRGLCIPTLGNAPFISASTISTDSINQKEANEEGCFKE